MGLGLLAALLVLAGATAGQAEIEGFGTSTPGGGCGDCTVYYVDTLNDSGIGSLRDAVSTGKRMVIFRVGGQITLTTGPIFVRGAFVTIDGSTAPWPGITLHGDGLVIRGNVGATNPTPTHDVIVRGIRIRSVPNDGIQVSFGAYNVVISQVSVWGSVDGLIDITENSHDVTVAWSILAGAVKAMLIKYNASNITLHHNLWVGGKNRNPQVSVNDLGTPATATTLDMRNNVVFDWKAGAGTAIHHGARANVVANVYSSPGDAVSD
jgi:pectate lyase